jgi:hypothetical protein
MSEYDALRAALAAMAAELVQLATYANSETARLVPLEVELAAMTAARDALVQLACEVAPLCEEPSCTVPECLRFREILAVGRSKGTP